jgi:FMN phosphatase YigB (HAD superfamily)
MDRPRESSEPRDHVPGPDPVPSGPAPRPASPLGGIILDVPDVVYDATLWRRWLWQLVGRLGVRVGPEEFFHAWDAHLVDVNRGRRELAEALETFLRDWGLSWAVVDEIEAASRIQRQQLDENVRSLPGVARTVDELARLGIPLAAWADLPTRAESLVKRLGRLTPGASYRAVLTSFDLEHTQPDDEVYRALLEALGIAPHQALYVGHDTRHLAGARDAGLRTAAFNFEPHTAADHFLNRFEDLLELVRGFAAAGPRPAAIVPTSPPPVDTARPVAG